jgi:peptidoglycan pentaglycine glycine transferase (the first glycine)
MKVIEITEKTRPLYEKFVETHPLATIHQTWEWGLFQSKTTIRDRFWVYAVEDGEDNGNHTAGSRILASAMIIRQNLPFKKCWFYCPRGPLADYSQAAALETLFAKITALAREQDAVFFRFDPPLEAVYNPPVATTMRQLHARPAHAHYQPEATLILDLKHEPEELLKRMKPKGRYNIKVAQKHGVTVRISDGHEADVKAFHALLAETAARDSFHGHPLAYYRNMLEVLGEPKPAPAHSVPSPALTRPSARLYLAEHDGKVLAGMIATYFRDTATYYFGASSSENRHTMAPYLLHWRAIQDARAAGYHYYDFFGISPDRPVESSPPAASSAPRKTLSPQTSNLTSGFRPHPWQKVTDFKLKFGGEHVNYFPAQEVVYKPFWYALIRFAKWALGILKR